MQKTRPSTLVSKLKLGAFTACLAVLAVVQAATAELPAALSQAPAGAHVVVIFPSMSDFSGKIALLNQTLGLESDEMADALGTFKAESGITEGLDDAGSALIIIQDLATAIETEQEPDFLLVLPVTDYPTFIANFLPEGGALVTDGVTPVTLPDGQDGFAKEVGGYAVMGDVEQAVTDYAAGGDANAIGDRVGELGLHYLDSCDAAAYVDIKALAPTLIEAIDKGLAEMQGEFDRMSQSGAMDAASLDSMKAMFALYGTAGKAIINSSEGVVATLDITEHGVGLTYAANFIPDSPVTKYLPGNGDGTASVLARLPKAPYIVAGAYDAKAIAFSELIEAALNAIPEGNAQVDAYRKAIPLVKQIQQYAGVFYTPDPNALMTQSGVLKVLQTYKVQDGPAFLKQTKDYINEMNGMAIPMAVPALDGGAPPAMTYATSYTENALQLDGVQVDQYSMEMQMPPQMLNQMGPAAGMMQMFTNFTGYATQDDGHYLSTTTLDQQLITQGLATGKTGDGMGSGDTLALIREKAVPPGPAAEAYLSFAGIVDTVGPLAAMFGGPAIQAPADLPPVAMGLGIQGSSSATRFYVPNETTKFIIDTVKDVQTQMMGGPGGPAGQPYGPGAPPPPF